MFDDGLGSSLQATLLTTRPEGDERDVDARACGVRRGSTALGSLEFELTVPSAPPSPATSSPRLDLLARLAQIGDDDLAEESVRLAAAVSAAQAELAAVLGEIERRRIHSTWDCPSIERFAGWKCQVSSSRAAALGVLGRAIDALPALGDAVVEGRVSVDKAVAIARVATPQSEAALVDLACASTVEQTQRFCAKWRRVGGESVDGGTEPDDSAARTRDDAALGRVIVIHDDDGVELRARFDHVHGMLVLRALDAVTARVRTERRDAVAADPVVAATRRSNRHRPGSIDEVPLEALDLAQWRAQGLLRMADRASGDAPVTVHRSGFTSDVIVHVPVAVLLDPTDVDAGPSPTNGNATSVPLATLEPRGLRLQREMARLLVCDASLHAVLEDSNGDPLHVGRRRTSISNAQRRAVHARDPHCRWPGCTAMTVQLHHRHHRVAGGHDDVENLIPLCTWHHGVVHRRSITIGREADGTYRFLRIDGSLVGAEAPTGRGRTTSTTPPTLDGGSIIDVLLERQRSLRIDVDSPLRSSQWMNDRFALSDVIAAVADRRDAALRRTVPTGHHPVESG